MLCRLQATEGPSYQFWGLVVLPGWSFRTSERLSGPAKLISTYASHHWFPANCQQALYLAIEFEISHSPWGTLWDTKEKLKTSLLLMSQWHLLNLSKVSSTKLQKQSFQNSRSFPKFPFKLVKSKLYIVFPNTERNLRFYQKVGRRALLENQASFSLTPLGLVRLFQTVPNYLLSLDSCAPFQYCCLTVPRISGVPGLVKQPAVVELYALLTDGMHRVIYGSCSHRDHQIA